MRFGVNKKDGCAPRTGTWGIIYNPETLCFEKIKSSLSAFYQQTNMCQSAAPSVSVNLFLYWRFCRQRLQQLNQIWAFSNLQQNFPYLIHTVHLLAVHFSEAHQPVHFQLSFQLSTTNCNRNVINKQKAWQFCYTEPGKFGVGNFSRRIFCGYFQIYRPSVAESCS